MVAPTQTDPRTKSLEQVKRKSQEALLKSSDSVATLKMIDTIQRLGIGHHFEEEINVLLGRELNWDPAQDLFATALHFRLRRHNGLPASSGTIVLLFLS